MRAQPWTRRQILRGAAGLALSPSLFSASASASVAADKFRESSDPRPRSMVLIDLFGGLDGVNAVVPYADDLYYRARPRLAVPAKSVARIDDYLGFAPAMGSLRSHWDDGRMAVVQGVGYPDPNLSHFKSKAIWHRALPKNGVAGDGWIARLRQHLWAEDARAELVTYVGKHASGAVYSARRPALQFDSPESFAWTGSADSRAAAEEMEDPGSGESGVLGRLQAMHRTSLRIAPAVLSIASAYKPHVEYPAGDFASKLRTISSLMQADFGARVYSLTLSSFDSHSSGLTSQEDMLREFCQGVDAFLRDLAGTSVEEDCLVFGASEFGRRLEENASRGTDHGAAAPVFLFGNSVVGGLYSEHPSLAELDETGSLRHGMDFRSVYAAIIDQWFGGRHAQVLQQEMFVPDLLHS